MHTEGICMLTSWWEHSELGFQIMVAINLFVKVK